MNERVFIRINGVGHAFSRELGCKCKRCRTVNYAMHEPPPSLAAFQGWDDPPWRAHTSGSIIIADAAGSLRNHILIDVGAGVVDSLVCSKLDGLAKLNALLITHWHPDHVLALNQLCESLKRIPKKDREGMAFEKIPLYCTLDTYDHLRDSGGQSYVLHNHLCFREILAEKPFEIHAQATIRLTPLPVAHSGIKGAVIFVAEVATRKAVFGWDMDAPNKMLPSGAETNLDVVNRNLVLLRGADVLFLPANTWKFEEKPGEKLDPKKSATGHTSYCSARAAYLKLIGAKQTFIVHMSGHEDGKKKDGKPNRGYGWTDSDWEAAVKRDRVKVARQGMIIEL